jgi:hypothetical protein
VAFGIQLQNANGDILVDGENVHPKIYEKITTATDPDNLRIDEVFTPTTSDIFVSVSSDIGAKVMLERIKVNSSSEYYGLSWRHHNTTIIPVKFYIYTLY